MFSKILFALFVSIVLTQRVSTDVLRQPRIINGEPADIKQFPFQVSLQNLHYGEFKFFCGGEIISRYGVLTAAHCLQTKIAERLLVRVGSSFHNNGGILHKVLIVISHPKFNDRLENDIGIVITKEDMIKDSRIVKIAPIWIGEDPEPDASVTCIGWGRTGLHDPPSSQLLAVNLTIVDRTDCSKNISAVTSSYFQLSKDHICAGDMSKGPYKGDSGGPLLLNGQVFGVAMVVSDIEHGFNFPTLFTRVKYYLGWIIATLDNFASN